MTNIAEMKIAAETRLPTKFAEFKLVGFEDPKGKEHVALWFLVMLRQQSPC